MGGATLWPHLFLCQCVISLLYLLPVDLPVLLTGELLEEAFRITGRLPVGLALLKELPVVSRRTIRDVHVLTLQRHM